MRSSTLALWAVAICLLAPAYAQSQPPPPSNSGNWLARIFSGSAQRGGQTQVLPRASSIMRIDQERETRLERQASEERIARHYRSLLMELRSENNRKVALAVAAAAPTPPPRPLVRSGVVIWGDSLQAPAPQDSTGAAPPPPLPPADPSGQQKSPRPKTAVPPTVGDAVDRVVDQISETIFDTPAAKPTPPGLFALALIGMFLVPAMGVGLVMIGIAHLRHYGFLPGTVIMALGGLVLWGSFIAARMISPDLLGAPAEKAPATADSAGALSPIDALRQPDLFANPN